PKVYERTFGIFLFRIVSIITQDFANFWHLLKKRPLLEEGILGIKRGAGETSQRICSLLIHI
ncbi:hypothetical protein, partial [uncultured Bilophila sp.]|uniref:hypothetical protein n=1 Tax=uncultured Bilophila sp. TaxID=529385 RepID=UPI00263448A9